MTVILNDGTFPGTWIVPRSFAGAEPAEVPSSASRCLGIVNQGRVEDRGVGVHVTFLEAI